MAYLYTKGGDKGSTGLFGGSRISKGSLQVDCYGHVDEANAQLGVAYANSCHDEIRQPVRHIQDRLFLLAAELASDEKGAAALQNPICDEDVAYLENLIDESTAITGKIHAFVVPGENPASAQLHVARTVMRRAERAIIHLSEEQPVREELLRYVNRLSDAVFALALLEAKLDQEDKIRCQVTELVREKMGNMACSGQDACLDNLLVMAQRARQKAAELAVPIVFAAVDAGGNLLLLQRMEGAIFASVDVAANKAYTSAAFKMPTHVLGEAAQPGASLYGIETSNGGKVVLFGGGFPLEKNGSIIGAIGVSGGTVEQDMEIAKYAMAGD